MADNCAAANFYPKITGLLGLAHRAGQVASGEDGALMSIKKGTTALVFLDASTGANTTKRITDACKYRSIKLAQLPANMLGTAIGKPGRMVAAIRKGTLADTLSVVVTQAALEI